MGANTKMQTSRKQQGFLMLEVLVAIVVLSIGMLGILGVILNSLKFTTSSNYRTIAAQQSYAMAETMRASVINILAYNNVATPTGSVDCMTSPPGAACTTSAQVASNDVFMWNARLQAMLPIGRGVVCQDSAAGAGAAGSFACTGTGQFVVKVCWDESRIPGQQGNPTQCVRTTL